MNGYRDYCAGVDEVGRGPLAGAVFAAAVVLDPDKDIPGLRDSKALSHKQRTELDEEIRAKAIGWSIAVASVGEIDRINILWASMLAMQRAVAGLHCSVTRVIVDGNRCPEFACPAEALVKGDTLVPAIMAASIIAKVARDLDMVRKDRIYPEYGLARNKGYATRFHLDALRKHGPTRIHRLSFAPCRQGELLFE
jgi:ribonuclease HII